MAQESRVPDPRDIVREFRRNYVNFHRLWDGGTKVPPGVILRDPKQSPIDESTLPVATRVLLDEYRQAHPGLTVAVVKYMRLVNGAPELVVEDEADLPPEDEFLSLTQTATRSAVDDLRVVTEIVVMRRLR